VNGYKSAIWRRKAENYKRGIQTHVNEGVKLSIRGPLTGKKTYLKKLLATEDITLHDFFVISEEPDVIVYRFIWDTKFRPDTVPPDSRSGIPTIDTRPLDIIAKINELENLLQEHFEEYEVEVIIETHTLKTAREKGRNVARSMAKIRFANEFM